jgi:hypothetical protein
VQRDTHAVAQARTDESDSIDDPKCGSDGADSIILVGLRIPKVGQDSVPEKLRNVAAMLLDRVGADAMMAS